MANSAVRHGADPASLAGFLAGAGADGVADRDALAALSRAERLAQSRLPVEPVLSRYLQGVAKGVPFERIESVVDALEVRLADSARRLDAALPRPPTGRKSGPASPRWITALTRSAWGCPRPRWIARSGWPPGDPPGRGGPGAGARDRVLVASGVNPDKSWDVVLTAWQSGYRGEDLERLGKALGRLSRDGQGAPAEIIDQVLSQIGDHAGREQVFRGAGRPVRRTGRRQRPPGLQKGQDPARDRPNQDRDRGNRMTRAAAAATTAPPRSSLNSPDFDSFWRVPPKAPRNPGRLPFLPAPRC